MDKRPFFLSFTAVYLTACLYYRAALALLPAAMLPIAVHELSHVLALCLLGQKITGLSADARGLCIHYHGSCSNAGHILAALAGPLGGAVYALVGFTDIAWLRQSAALSILLTGFNLLPLLPLDGGRAFSLLSAATLGEVRGARLCRGVSTVCLTLLLTGGVYLAVWKKSTALLAAAIWLLLFQNEEEALVKSDEII